MFTLLQHGTLYAPDERGIGDVLMAWDRIAAVGHVDVRAIERTGLPLEVLDVRGCAVTPGLMDPHQHLLGGSGEEGFSTQTPNITISEIAPAGITTVVGVLGVDTTMKTMAGLLAAVKALREDGLSAYLWSGGYNVPPASITQSVRNDMMFVEEVVGAGEIAIADERGLCPAARELAKVVLDTHVGGILSGKAGRTHFHVGEHEQRLLRLRELLDGDFAVRAEMLYPTHVSRTEALMEEAAALAQRGSHVDFDTMEGNVAKWVGHYLAHGGPADRLTLSSDAGKSSPCLHFRECMVAAYDDGLTLARLLPFITANVADALKLPQKGRLDVGRDADLLVLDERERTVRHLVARGRLIIRDGALVRREHFLEGSSRRIALVGTEAV